MEVVFDQLSIQACTKSITGEVLSSHALLHPLNSSIPSGSMCCILGGSGSGKTTLLSVIGNRYDASNLVVDGSVDFKVGNATVAKHTNCKSVGFVTQHDYLLPFLTARETLLYAALLLHPSPASSSLSASNSCIKNGYFAASTTDVETARTVATTATTTTKTRQDLCEAIVDGIILKLGLKECADGVYIGGDAVSQAQGLSGGEKRRVSVGIQMLTNPRILCADEPTSGLDSFTALTVVEALKELTLLGTENVAGSGADGDRSESTVDNTGITVICSIHQPRADIFVLFDHILLLSGGGELIYSSSISASDGDRCNPHTNVVGSHRAGLDMLAYFARLGHHCPSGCNPADYFVDLSSVDTRDAAGGTEQADRQRVKLLADACRAALEPHRTESSTSFDSKIHNCEASETSLHVMKERGVGRFHISLMQQIVVLCSRNMRNSLRDWNNIVGCMLQCVVMALVAVGLFYRLADNDIAAIRSRPGMIYMVLASEPYILTIILVDRYTTELTIFDRELQDKMYSSTAYLLAYIASSYPFLVIQSIIAATIMFFGCNMRGASNGHSSIISDDDVISLYMYGTTDSATQRFYSYLTMVLVICATAIYISGLALLGASLFRAFSIASLFCNTAFTFICLTSGFLINTSSLPVYVSWIKNISFFHYAFNIMFANEMEGRVFPGCPYADAFANVSSTTPSASSNSSLQDVQVMCSQYNGDVIMQQFDVPALDSASMSSWIDHPWFGLICLILGCHVVSAVLLEFVRHSPNQIVGGGSRTVITGSNDNVEDHNRNVNKGDAVPDLEQPSSELSSSVIGSDLITSNAYGSNQRIEIVIKNINISVTKPVVQVASNPRIASASTDIMSADEGDIELCSDSNLLEASGDPESPPVSPGYSNIGPTGSWRSAVNGLCGNTSLSTHKVILSNISCTIEPGKLTALMGGSGSGKTTLLNVIVGRVNANNTNRICERSGLPIGNEFTYNMSGSVTCSRITSNADSVSADYLSTRATNSQMIGFVSQFDHHLANLTVFESLMFHAQMKCHMLSEQQKRERILYLIRLLGLQACMHTRVGCATVDMSGSSSGTGAMSKTGISGGEKRRLSVAIQMLLDPPVCVLDEPTTGLDTFSARHLIKMLHSIAHTRQRTVLVSIHQPRYDVYAQFDNIILLSRGHMIWSGDLEGMMTHFASYGFSCPQHCNPADFILDITSIDYRNANLESTSQARLKVLIQAYRTARYVSQATTIGSSSSCDECHDANMVQIGVTNSDVVSNEYPMAPIQLHSKIEKVVDEVNKRWCKLSIIHRLCCSICSPGKWKRSVEAEAETLVNHHHSLVYAFPLLLQRSYINLTREPEAMIGRCSQGLFLGAIVVLFYAPIGHTQISVQNRIGCIFFIASICFIGVLNCIAMYPTERNVFYREYVDNDVAVVNHGPSLRDSVVDSDTDVSNIDVVGVNAAVSKISDSACKNATGGYSALAFFLCYFTLSFPFILLSAVGVGIFLGIFVGLNHSISDVLVLIYVVFLELLIGECIGVAFCSFFFHIGFSVNIMSAFLSALCLSSGLVSLKMSELFNILNFASPFKYAAWISLNVAFKDQQFDCAANALNVNGTCLAGFTEGNQVLEAYNMTNKAQGDMTAHLWILTGLSLVFVVLAYMALLYRVGTLKSI